MVERDPTNPDEWTLDNYDEVLNTRGMEDAFINSLIITVPTTFLVIVIAAMAAYASPGCNPVTQLALSDRRRDASRPASNDAYPVLQLYNELSSSIPRCLLSAVVFSERAATSVYGLLTRLMDCRSLSSSCGTSACCRETSLSPRTSTGRQTSRYSAGSLFPSPCPPSPLSPSSSSYGRGTTCSWRSSSSRIRTWPR